MRLSAIEEKGKQEGKAKPPDKPSHMRGCIHVGFPEGTGGQAENRRRSQAEQRVDEQRQHGARVQQVPKRRREGVPRAHQRPRGQHPQKNPVLADGAEQHLFEQTAQHAALLPAAGVLQGVHLALQGLDYWIRVRSVLAF